jgi:hypothetical protein
MHFIGRVEAIIGDFLGDAVAPIAGHILNIFYVSILKLALFPRLAKFHMKSRDDYLPVLVVMT